MATQKAIEVTLPLRKFATASLGVVIPKKTLEVMGYQEDDLVIVKIPFQRLKDNVTEKRRLE